jgi:hypothetical protein
MVSCEYLLGDPGRATNVRPDASSVAFPASDPVGVARQAPLPRPPHLPFRRISLPSAPTLLHRNSVLSVSSVEDGELSPHRPSRTRRQLDSPVRRPKRREGSSRPGDPSRQAKARRIVDEFHETEKAYVKGLEMVYSVSVLQTGVVLSLTPNSALPHSHN